MDIHGAVAKHIVIFMCTSLKCNNTEICMFKMQKRTDVTKVQQCKHMYMSIYIYIHGKIYICRMHTETTGLGVAGLCNVGTPPSFGIYSIDFLPNEGFFLIHFWSPQSVRPLHKTHTLIYKPDLMVVVQALGWRTQQLLHLPCRWMDEGSKQ